MSGNAEDICHVPRHDPATGNATLETARRAATVSRGTVEDAGEPSAGRETFPTLPHLDFSEEDLERLHPRILAPPEEPLHDLMQDEHDAVYQHGLRVAKELEEQADESGRKRHPEALRSAAGRGSRRRPTGPTGRLRQAPGRLCDAGPTWSLTKAARRRSAKDIPSQSRGADSAEAAMTERPSVSCTPIVAPRSKGTAEANGPRSSCPLPRCPLAGYATYSSL